MIHDAQNQTLPISCTILYHAYDISKLSSTNLGHGLVYLAQRYISSQIGLFQKDAFSISNIISSEGEDEIWPNFLLYSVKGLRRSERNVNPNENL